MSQMLRKLNTMEKPAAIAENIFLLLLGLYMLYLFTFNTTYIIFFSLSLARILLFALAAAGGARIVLKNLWSRNLLFALVLGIVYILVYYQLKDIRFLFLAVVTVSCIEIDYHRVAKVCASVGIICLLLTFAACFSGAIENLVYFRAKGSYLRSSWGMGYPTDMSAFVLMMISTVWIAWKEFPDELAIIGAFFSVCVAFTIAASRTSLASSLVFLFVVSWHLLERQATKLKTISSIGTMPLNRSAKITEFLKKLMVFSFPILAFCFLLLVIGYAKGLHGFDTLDGYLSKRLQYTLRIFKEEGIHPFGIYFYNVGNGGNTIEPPSVYFLDSSYVLILIQYGWVLFGIIMVLWCQMANRARGSNDLRLLMVMTVICVQSFTEHHFTELNFNILACLLFSHIPDRQNKDTEQELTFLGYCRKHICGMVTIFVTTMIIIMLAPVQLGRIRTILAITGYSGETLEKLRLIAQYLASLILIAVPVWTVTWYMTGNPEQRKHPKFMQAAMLVISIICMGGLLSIAHAEKINIEESDTRYISMIRADTPALNTILENAQGTVYAESVPEIYQMHFDGLSRPVLCGDDLARLHNATILTDLSINRQRFTEMGFAFCVISRYHAVYSNDEAVITAMRDAGYEWTDYYNVAFDVDLELLSQMNETPLSDAGSLLINGPVDAIINGPGLDLYAGTYLLSYELKTTPGQNNDVVVCDVQISDFYEGRILAEHPITAGEFNQDGWMQGGVTFRTKGSRNTEFRFIPEEGQQLEVVYIRYQKISN